MVDVSELKSEVSILTSERNASRKELATERRRSNRLALILSQACDVLAEPGRYLDGGLAVLRQILSSEDALEDISLERTMTEAWRQDAMSRLVDFDSDKRRLARRLIAAIDELDEAEAQHQGKLQRVMESHDAAWAIAIARGQLLKKKAEAERNG